MIIKLRDWPSNEGPRMGSVVDDCNMRSIVTIQALAVDSTIS